MKPTRHVVVVGDVVLDRDVEGRTERLCPDAPVPVVDVEQVRASPGGAGLTALLCRGADTDVTLVAPVAEDDAGAELCSMLQAADVGLIPLDHAGPTRRKTRVRSAGQSLLRLDDGGPGTPAGELPAQAVQALREADVVLVSCYGAGTTDHPALRELLTARARRRPVVWDPHPRGGTPVPGCTLVTPNLAEARGELGPAEGPVDTLAQRLLTRWEARGVCVTVGGSGAWLVTASGEPTYVPTRAIRGGDPCGAGDRFAATTATALALGATVSEAVTAAVEQASAWVGTGGAGGFRARSLDARSPDDGRPVAPMNPTADDVVTRMRDAGGTVVATGGCFDVLHAGHVQCLEAARRLGDALVVLVNSDASVRRLKGAGRPVQSAADRARVLMGLSCVDAVVVFEEDDPRRALEQLRPQVWAKGGDYEGAELTEASLVRSWGGRVVLLPYLAGRSTTSILQDAR